MKKFENKQYDINGFLSNLKENRIQILSMGNKEEQVDIAYSDTRPNYSMLANKGYIYGNTFIKFMENNTSYEYCDIVIRYENIDNKLYLYPFIYYSDVYRLIKGNNIEINTMDSNVTILPYYESSDPLYTDTDNIGIDGRKKIAEISNFIVKVLLIRISEILEKDSCIMFRCESMGLNEFILGEGSSTFDDGNPAFRISLNDASIFQMVKKKFYTCY